MMIKKSKKNRKEQEKMTAIVDSGAKSSPSKAFGRNRSCFSVAKEREEDIRFSFGCFVSLNDELLGTGAGEFR